jgi:hypothetical protein
VAAAIEQQHRIEPTDSLVMVLTDEGGRCFADPNYTPRALALAAGLLLDAIESGLVEIRLEAADGGLRATVAVVHAEGDDSDRQRLVSALEHAGPDVPTVRPSGAVGLAIALLYRVVLAQAGRVEIEVDGWPRISVWLPDREALDTEPPPTLLPEPQPA